MRSRIALIAVLLFHPAAAAAAAYRAQSLEAAPGTVRVAVEFDAPEWREWAREDRPYRHLAWPGLSPEAAPGFPALPTAFLRVAVPRGGRVELGHDVAVRGRAQGVRFPLAPSPLPPPPPGDSGGRPDAVVHWTESADEGVMPAGPTTVVEMVGEGMERGVRIVTVAVRPVSWDPGTGEAVWMSRVDVTLSVQDAAPALAATRVMDAVSEVDAQATLVNPQDAARFGAPAGPEPPPTPTGIPDVWFDDAPAWLKVFVTSNGIYRLDAAALDAAGVDVALLDPRTLRLFSGPLVPALPWTTEGWDSVPAYGVQPGWDHVYETPDTAGFRTGFGASGGFEEVAMTVTGEADGSLDAGDAIVFYGLGPDNYRDRFGLPLDTGEDYVANPLSDRTVYWLALGETVPGAFPAPPRRMADVDAAPLPGGALVTTSRARLHAEENHHYDPSLYQARLRWEEFFWDFFLSTDTSGDTPPPKTIPLPSLVPGTTLDTRIRLWGAQVPTNAGGEASRHHIQVTVNGAGCFTELVSWGGPGPYAAVSPRDVVATGVCAEDVTRVSFASLPVPVPPLYSRLDKVQLAWIEIDYLRTLDLAGGPGELEVDVGDPGRTVRVAGAPGGTLWLLDVADFRNPRRLTNAARSGGAVDVSLAGGAGTVLALAGETQLRAPAALLLDTRPEGGWLRDVGEALDYVIVCDDAQQEAAEDLAAWRRDHLYPYTPDRPAAVRVVRVSDVMDEFAWGLWDVTALRHFLEYAYRYYAGDDRLAYVLLLGDHTYDPRDHLRTGVRDLVPSTEDNRDPLGNIGYGNVQYVSDEPLVLLDDRLDLYGDLYVGRITTATAAEAREIIQNKVIRSEASPNFGPWRSKAILVADDVCQARRVDGLGFVHMTQSESLGVVLPQAFDIEKVYLYDYGEECVYDAKPDAKRALLTSWSEGAWMVNYIGHGADVVLADEHVYDLGDTPTLNNDGRLPIFGAFSCSVGKFNKPQAQGVAEALLRQPRTGALVALGATQVTFSGANATLNYNVYRHLFPASPARPVSVGAALTRAKRQSAPIGNDRIDKKYVCFGDPGSRPSVPLEDLAVDGPPELLRGQLADVRTTVPGGANRAGAVDLLVQDDRILKDRNSRGETLIEHARRIGNFFSNLEAYVLPGADLYRGTSAVLADTALSRFVVPVSLRGGPRGRIRAYGEGTAWDGLGAIPELAVGGPVPAGGDTLGPVITLATTGGRVAPGQIVTAHLEDASGINLTRLFEFRSVLLKVFDGEGLEQFRQDLTEGFQYDEGSYTRGSVTFRVADLPEGAYRFLLAATDNYNNRGEAVVDLEVSAGASGSALDRVFAYPNPFDPEAGPTRVVLTLDRPAQVSVRVYAVSGRLVREIPVGAGEGTVSAVWDGRDAAGDPVANGVYLVSITAQPSGGGESARHLERVVVLR